MRKDVNGLVELAGEGRLRDLFDLYPLVEGIYGRKGLVEK